MTKAERKLLIWCGTMLVRTTPLTEAEAEEIDHLIADVQNPLPNIVWDMPKAARRPERRYTADDIPTDGKPESEAVAAILRALLAK
jgi:hypothetical protein